MVDLVVVRWTRQYHVQNRSKNGIFSLIYRNHRQSAHLNRNRRNDDDFLDLSLKVDNDLMAVSSHFHIVDTDDQQRERQPHNAETTM